MRSKIKLFVAMIVVGALITGCGVFSTKSKGKKETQTIIALSGEWRSECIKGDWFDFSQYIDIYKFSALGDFDKISTMYKDQCNTAELTTTLRGTYDALGATKDVPDAKDINFTVTEALVSPRSDIATETLNAVSYCGVSDWKTNKEFSVLDKDCTGMDFKKGTVVFDIYRLKDNRLYLGKKMTFFSAETNDTRPAKLEEDRALVRQ